MRSSLSPLQCRCIAALLVVIAQLTLCMCMWHVACGMWQRASRLGHLVRLQQDMLKRDGGLHLEGLAIGIARGTRVGSSRGEQVGCVMRLIDSLLGSNARGCGDGKGGVPQGLAVRATAMESATQRLWWLGQRRSEMLSHRLLVDCLAMARKVSRLDAKEPLDVVGLVCGGELCVLRDGGLCAISDIAYAAHEHKYSYSCIHECRVASYSQTGRLGVTCRSDGQCGASRVAPLPKAVPSYSSHGSYGHRVWQEMLSHTLVFSPSIVMLTATVLSMHCSSVAGSSFCDFTFATCAKNRM